MLPFGLLGKDIMGSVRDIGCSGGTGRQGCQHYVVMRGAGDFPLDSHPFITLLVKMAPSSSHPPYYKC